MSIISEAIKENEQVGNIDIQKLKEVTDKISNIKFDIYNSQVNYHFCFYIHNV